MLFLCVLGGVWMAPRVNFSACRRSFIVTHKRLAADKSWQDTHTIPMHCPSPFSPLAPAIPTHCFLLVPFIKFNLPRVSSFHLQRMNHGSFTAFSRVLYHQRQIFFSIISHLLKFYRAVICLQQVFAVKVTGTREKKWDVWSAVIHWSHRADPRPVISLWTDPRLALMLLLCVCSPANWGCSPSQTPSIYGRPGCHGNWGIVCKTQRGNRKRCTTTDCTVFNRNSSSFKRFTSSSSVLRRFSCVNVKPE